MSEDLRDDRPFDMPDDLGLFSVRKEERWAVGNRVNGKHLYFAEIFYGPGIQSLLAVVLLVAILSAEFLLFGQGNFVSTLLPGNAGTVAIIVTALGLVASRALFFGMSSGRSGVFSYWK